MKVKKLILHANAYPARLRNIASPPAELFYIGAEPSDWLDRPKGAIVGSRSMTPLRQAGHGAAGGNLAERGMVIISGLALGVDGLADALPITDAAEKSSTLHTARFALEQGRDVLAVPGNITSPNSVGTNNLIRACAAPVTSVEDIMYVPGVTHLPAEPVRRGDTAEEKAILNLLYGGASDGHELLVGSRLPAVDFNQALTMLEVSGKVRSLGNNHWPLK